MTSLLFGVLTLSLLHSILPNHWFPLALIAKNAGWNKVKILIFSILISLAHALSTVFLGVIVAFLGFRISEEHEILAKTSSSIILIILGFFFISKHFRTGNPHHHAFGMLSVSALLLAMFFSPCIEITPFYLLAGTIGWYAVFMISLIYVLTTVLIIPAMTILSLRGLKLARLHVLEHYENLLIGLILISFGFLNLVFN